MEITFDLRKTEIYQAVRWENNPLFKLAKPLAMLFLCFFILTFGLFLYGFIGEKFSSAALLGISIIFLVLSIQFRINEAFFASKLKKPRLRQDFGGQAKLLKDVAVNPEKYNLAEFLDLDVARSFSYIETVAKKFNTFEINSTVLFYAFLETGAKLNFIFSRLTLDMEQVRETVFQQLRQTALTGSDYYYADNFEQTLLEAFKIAESKKRERVGSGDVISALARKDLTFKKILMELELKAEDVENLTWWQENIEKRIEERKKIFDYRNLAKQGSVARDWAYGYTINLDRYSTDLTDAIRRQGFQEIIGHQKSIEQVERILSRTEINNALIVGEPGTGRGAIVQAIAQKCTFGETLPTINYKRVVQLDLTTLLAESASNKKVEAILDTILKECVTAKNIILVINDLHNYIGSGMMPGIVDISGILTPYLRMENFQIIGVTTYAGLHKNIEQNPSILSLFEKVEVSEISFQENMMLLESRTFSMEARYNKFVTYPALREIMELSSRYMPAVSFPKKAIDLLDEIMVFVTQSTKSNFVLPEHVERVVAEKTQIPVGKIEEKEKEVLLNLESLIHQRIINQEEAVSEISTAMRRARADITIRKGVIGAFLFMGPTGVGKTETSKAMAQIYFGSESRMIRLDMSEFQDVKDIPRMIGSPGQEGTLTTQVMENPFSLILLDEIEKCHPNVLNLFLQILDEGHVTDGLGRKVSFKNAMIIATSNAGYQIILDSIKSDIDTGTTAPKDEISMRKIKERLLDYVFQNGIFRPEFINRFDAVVLFKGLTPENLLAIAELMLQNLKKNLKAKDIDFIISTPLKERIVELGYDPVFGARQMRRVIQDKVENSLATAILAGKLPRGCSVEVDPETFEVTVK